jgi:photosystem II stability/assembly factor-like uncharacterized protein
MQKQKFMQYLLLLVLLLYGQVPAQTEWEWQNPLPQGNVLFACQMLDSSTVVAVGGAGVVLKTTDNGVTWNQKFHVGDLNYYLKDVSFANKMIGTAVGRSALDVDSGIVIRTEDGGNSWVMQQIIGLPSRSLNGVYFLNSDTGWAVGNQGRILRTSDGGQFWEDQSDISFGLDLSKVFFYNVNLGWAVGNDGSILKTTNSGYNWSLVHWSDSYNFYSMFFLDSLVGYVGAEISILKGTTNGGNNWFNINTPGAGFIGAIHFFNYNTGIIGGAGGKIFRTTNLGVTWTETYSGINDVILDFSFIDSNKGYAVGQEGVILKTTDGGLTWQSLSEHKINTFLLKHCYLITPDIGLVIGEGGVIYRTTNAGATWALTSVNEAPILNRISFANNQIGVTVGRYGVVLRTTDAGINWTNVFGGPGTGGQQQYDVQYVNTRIAYSIGEQQILKTTDSGLNWIQSTYGETGWAYAVHFINPDKGFTGGDFGKIRKTTDGGTTWTTVASFPEAALIRRITFVDTLRGFAVGGYGVIISTTDGGDNWNLIRQGHWTEEMYDICFTDNLTGYIVGAVGLLFKTTDGGTTWNREHSSFSGYIEGMHFYDTNIGMMVGENAAILRTKSSTAPVFTPNTTQINLGTVQVGTTKIDSIIITNTGNALLTIDSTLWQNSDIVITPTSATLYPMETLKINIYFTPQNPGTLNTYIIFYNNSGSSPDSIQVIADVVTEVASENEIPKNFSLYQNYPNPFNPETEIKFDIPQSTHIKLEIFNVLGQKVTTLLDNFFEAGRYTYKWNATGFSSGIYFYRIVTDAGFTSIKKGVLLK